MNWETGTDTGAMPCVKQKLQGAYGATQGTQLSPCDHLERWDGDGREVHEGEDVCVHTEIHLTALRN